MNRIAIFGGTSEGRALAQELALAGAEVQVFVATAYGEESIAPVPHLHVAAGRLNTAQMAEALLDLGCVLAVDATHPYAKEVTRNLCDACAKTGIEYLRLLRQTSVGPGVRRVADCAEAADLLQTLPGNILLTVGSKELAAFTRVDDWQNRLFARVLPSPKVVEDCAALGFRGRNLICMQGPFTKEMNAAMLEMLGCSVLVTKDSGKEGGTPEKLAAAEHCGAQVLLIGRPSEETGLSYAQMKQLLWARLHLAPAVPEQSTPPRFPIFIALPGAPVLVVGGGAIAARRTKTLLAFGAVVTVISPHLCPEMQMLRDRIIWYEQCYAEIKQVYRLVVAATNDRTVNAQVGIDCIGRGIPVSVADQKEASTFWFPAVFQQDNVVAGIVSTDGDHAKIKQTALLIRKSLGEKT